MQLHAYTPIVVVCRTSTNCSGVPGDDLGEMTIEECCTSDKINGLGFSEGESCLPCIGELISDSVACLYNALQL